MELLLGIVGGVVGVLIGAGIGFLLAERRSRGRLAQLETAKAVVEQQLAGTADQLRNQTTQTELLTGRNAELAAKIAQQQADNAVLRTQLDASAENLASQRALLDEANRKLTDAFANVSLQALEKNNATFLAMAETRFKTLSTEAAGTLEQRKAQIEGILKPLHEMLNQYQLRLAEVEKTRGESYAALRQQIGQIAEVERTLSAQTTRLVGALTRPNVRGQWGEITLRKLVELAGLSDHCDFDEQATVVAENDEGGARSLRPDMVINLPQERSIVIDCKAVLGAFLDAAGAADDAARQAHMQRHAELVRSRVRDLSQKAYWAQFANSPEFVVLFLPGESFLYAAVEHDAGLLEDAIRAKVILATPTTLIALLKTVAYGWRQEALSRNAEDIRNLGVEIYDRLAVLANHMDKLGRSIDQSVGHYNSAVKSLESRLLVSARKMGELGAKGEKEMPEAMEGVDKRTQELSSVLNPEKSPLLPE